MKKINIAKLLKDCPKGTKLYSLVHGEVELTRIGVECIYCKPNYLNYELGFNLDGRWVENQGECILFPSKENRDWTKFQRPFKDGDIVATLKGNQIFIFKENVVNIDNSFSGVCYCGYDIQENKLFKELRLLFSRHATEEEKQKLFDAIKDNGYHWNAETKTLEKLIKPKFKVGDWVKYKYYERKPEKVVRIENNMYCLSSGVTVLFQDESAWDLTTDKFDITTLKPFESRVLVRISNHSKWVTAFYSHYDKEAHLHHCVVGGLWYKQCIPYNDETKHLLDTTNDCNEYYKTWE